MLKDLKVLIKEESIQKRISELANKISADYKDKELVLICVLKGAVYFAIDLSKKIENDLILDFVKVSSYKEAEETSGNIEFNLDISTDIKGKDVIIVEDIIDSGITLNYLHDYLIAKKPNSLKICVLLDKKERRKKDIKVDYIGFEIKDKFVIGYGLDYKEKYRNLPYVGYMDKQ